MDRSTAAKVSAMRRKAIPNVKLDLDKLGWILETEALGPQHAISNATLADMLWGELPDGCNRRDTQDQRQRMVRKRVQQLRGSGSPIALALGSGGGYFWADGSPESLAALRATSEMLDKRADMSHKMAARLVGIDVVEYQAQRAAATIDNEQEQEKQEAALRQFVERVTRNPLTRKLFLKVVGQRSSGKEKAALAALRKTMAEKLLRLKRVLEAGLEEVTGESGGGG